MSSYQKGSYELAPAKKTGDEALEEADPLLDSGHYGSIQSDETFPGDGYDDIHQHRRIKRSLFVIVGGLVLFVAAMSLTGSTTGQPLFLTDLEEVDTFEIPVLGRSHFEDIPGMTREQKKAFKAKRKADKRARKAARTREKEERDKAKKAERAKRDKAKNAERAKKKKAKIARKKAKKYVPTGYPGCPRVFVAYSQIPMSWAAHEAASQAADCHLSSIHNAKENTKLHTAGLWELSTGLEIAMGFSGGYLLNKTFYLGGSVANQLVAPPQWEWVDGSAWDYGPNATTADDLPGTCLTSNVNIMEIGVKNEMGVKQNISYVNHWKSNDCTTPLPAIYKCCLPTEAPTMAPGNEKTTTTTTTTQMISLPKEGEVRIHYPSQFENAESESLSSEDASLSDSIESPSEEDSPSDSKGPSLESHHHHHHRHSHSHSSESDDDEVEDWDVDDDDDDDDDDEITL